MSHTTSGDAKQQMMNFSFENRQKELHITLLTDQANYLCKVSDLEIQAQQKLIQSLQNKQFYVYLQQYHLIKLHINGTEINFTNKDKYELQQLQQRYMLFKKRQRAITRHLKDHYPQYLKYLLPLLIVIFIASNQAFWPSSYVSGKIKITHKNGDHYEGDWKYGVMQGYGRLNSKKGYVYEGYFTKNQFHGKGIKVANGSSYEGDWVRGNMAGRGTFKWKDGSSYTGQMINGQMHGHGQYTYVRGDVYIGEFSNNQFNGLGTIYYVSGQKFAGTWKNGVKHGKGKAHVFKIIDEEWENGSKCGMIFC